MITHIIENIPYTADEVKAMVKTFEEFRKKYNEALEKAMKLALSGNVSALAAGEIFPELENEDKSDDERIRKEIISALKNANYKGVYDKHLAWLEKQGEQKQTWKPSAAQLIVIKDLIEDENTSKVNKVVLRGMFDEFKQFTNTHKREIDDAYLQGICDAKHEIEKQGEQPTDKIEPKFKVGDWITDDDYDGDYTWKIVEVKPLDYILQSQDGNIVDDTISYVDEHFHLWTIQDAKDGDVLVTTSARNCPFIYRKTDHNNNLAYFYAGINGNGNFCEGCIKRTLYHFGSASNVAPATKEQRDLLFEKMREAGYEWDSEKKELKKIELKTLNADEVIAWLEKHIIEWKGQDLIKTFTPNSPAGKSYIVEQFKEDFGL